MAVDGVEEVGVTTDTTVAGIDIGQLGLPSAITDLLSAANSYGSYRFNVMLDESLSSTKIAAVEQALNDAVAQRRELHWHRRDQRYAGPHQPAEQRPLCQDLRPRRRYYYRPGR